MSALALIVGGSPRVAGAGLLQNLKVPALRALRTLLQGVAASFGTAGGHDIVHAGYWSAFGYSCLGALVTAAASFLNNAAFLLPADPTQKAT